VNQQSSFYLIELSDSGQRLDKFLSFKYPSITRSYLQNLISRGNVTVNSNQEKTGYQLKINDKVEISFPELQSSHIEPEEIPLDIVFEDKSLLVLNKSAGMIVHPGAGNYQGTLVNALLYHCKNLSGINGILRPGIVHRLDKYTSGLLVVAKNDRSHVHLSKQFEQKSIFRIYHSLVWGVPGEAGEIITQIGRSKRDRKKMTVLKDGGKEAITEYRILNDFLYLSLLEIKLKTGRTHQIRVHCTAIGHPIVGDIVYGGRRARKTIVKGNDLSDIFGAVTRQMLHARHLEFVHPATETTVKFEAPVPRDMQALISALRQKRQSPTQTG